MLFRDLNGIDVHPVLKPPLVLVDLDIISTHLPLPHAPILCERPVFEPVTSLPLHRIVAVLILVPELDGNLIVGPGEKLLAKAIIFLLFPLPGEEIDDIVSAGKKPIAIAP